MEAPDKIYVNFPFGEKYPWCAPMVTKQGLDQHDTIYIRKDALLDYIHQRIEDLNSPLNGVFGSTERDNCNERISELLLLIDKLNEM